MKRVYEKPYAYIETFELSQHIASCTLNMKQLGNVVDCYAVYSESDKYGDIRLFLDGNGNCQVEAESFCTYNMADATFSS